MNHFYCQIIRKIPPNQGSDNLFIKQVLVLFCICFSLSARSQSFVIDSNRYSDAAAAAVSAYHLSMDKESKLYSGPEHMGYDPKMIGIAYFDSDAWQNGSIYYDGMLYRNVPMKYDEVLDKVVVQHFNTIFKLELISDKIKWFTLAGHTFLYLNADSKNNIKAGFYDLLVTGNIPVLAKRTKTITELIQDNEVKKRVDDKNIYYIIKDSVYHTVSNKRSLLKVLSGRKKEVQQYLRKNKIKFKRNSEYAIIKAIQYYNQLSH